jgi:hypothetical protein
MQFGVFDHMDGSGEPLAQLFAQAVMPELAAAAVS